jgi:hypothetical protein
MRGALHIVGRTPSHDQSSADVRPRATNVHPMKGGREAWRAAGVLPPVHASHASCFLNVYPKEVL